MTAGLRERVAHCEWLLRKRRSQIANLLRRPFVYEHRLIGPFIYHPADDLSRHMLLHDFEKPELLFAMRQSRRAGTIVDVGANIGVFTVACARAAGDRGQVIALEPSPAAFAKLRLTCTRLKIRNVELLQIAGGAANTRRSFVASIHELRHHLADARPDAHGAIEVDTRRLDDVCGERAGAVNLLKVDVEGHEVEVLRGAPRILGNGRAHLIVEINPAALEAAGTSPAMLVELLSRTHECVAAVQPDGYVHKGGPSLVVEPPYEMVNTLWAPRRTTGGSD